MLSPSTVKRDRTEKMTLYAEYGPNHLWLIDAEERQLEVYRLSHQLFLPIDLFKGEVSLQAGPYSWP